MTECTLHLAGLWISAAISNMSYSNKAGSATAKQAWFTGKGSRSAAVLTLSIKNFPIGLHLMYLYFPDTPYIIAK
jgi:hypothetical protein